MADVFISYKQRMRPKVREIARALEALGLSVWFDAELETGKSFSAVINAELEKAGCVIVCWTPDAFAPDDGSEVSWVEAEASVARERKVIVPILLERTPLKAPWNMFHTERMMDWSGAADDPAWLNVLDAVGRHVGRPDLADYARAKAAGDPAELAKFTAPGPDQRPPVPGQRPPLTVRFRQFIVSAPRAVRWVVGAALVCAFGAGLFLVRMGFEPGGGQGSYLYLAAPLASSAVFAFALWRGKVLDFGRALFAVLAGGVGYLAAILTLPLIQPMVAAIGIPGPGTVGFSQGLLSGTVGAFVALGGIMLLVGNVHQRDWLRLAVGSLALGLVCALLGTGILSFINSSNFFWIVIVWTLGYGALLASLVATRSAKTM